MPHSSHADLCPEHCIHCGKEGPERVCPKCCINPSCYVPAWRQAGLEVSPDHFYCPACKQCDERRDCRGPGMKFWTGPDGKLRHESCGVFVRTPDFRFVFYRRTKFPVGAVTVPSGHVDARKDGTAEEPAAAAARELPEEIRIRGVQLTDVQLWPVATDDIAGDRCRQGADVHLWHSFRVVPGTRIDPGDITVIDEGVEPVLLTLGQALNENLTVPVRYVIKMHAKRLMM